MQKTDIIISHTKQNRGKGLILLLLIVFLVILMLGNPSSSAWWIKCPLYLFTGWQCPFCGLQRQLHALLHLHFAEAWRLNPVLLMCYPYFAILFLSYFFPDVFRNPRLPRCLRRFFRVCISDRVLLIFFCILLVWGVLRNVLQ